MDEIVSHKIQRVKDIRARGVDPYPARGWEHDSTAAAVAAGALERRVSTVGRLVQIRQMGKASFAHLQDESGKIQLYFKKDIVGDASYQSFKDDLAVGDFIRVEGRVFKSKTGETTIEVGAWALLSKAIRPLPEKWHGLTDTEERHRRRHLDLISNAEVRETFAARSKIVSAVRKAFADRGFLEVETPVLLSQAGGAAARPFETHHNALDQKMVLRIATELYLKRLIIGGFEKVYEIGRIFRNEGIDTRHNPEFTMLEAYQAYADYGTMAEVLENVFSECCAALGKTEVEYRGMKVPLKPPFQRVYLPELWKKGTGEDIHEVLAGKRFNHEKLQKLANRLDLPASPDTPGAKIFERIFDGKILTQLDAPAFVLDHPTAITPLAKTKPGDEAIVERFEFFIGGEELANAYSELNDPIDQRDRFEEQARQKREEKEEEAQLLDEDFVEAMEVGMPPTGGIGIGIDRLVMLFTGKPSIREVILFPTLRTEVTDGKDGTEGKEGAAVKVR